VKGARTWSTPVTHFPVTITITMNVAPRCQLVTRSFAHRVRPRPGAHIPSFVGFQRRFVLKPPPSAPSQSPSSPHQHVAPNSKGPTPPPDHHVGVTYPLPKAFCIGSCAGFLGSLAGMGGGFVMIPLMTSRLLQLSQHQAHGTSLFAVATTGAAGALSYSGQVDWRLPLPLQCRE
jgi:hypothetical protein